MTTIFLPSRVVILLRGGPTCAVRRPAGECSRRAPTSVLAAAHGVSVRARKVLAFAVSSFIAGVGGVTGLPVRQRHADKFDYLKSLTFLAFATSAASTSVYGAISGGVLVAGGISFTFLTNVLHVSDQLHADPQRARLIIAADPQPRGRGRRRSHDAARSETATSGEAAPVHVPAGGH